MVNKKKLFAGLAVMGFSITMVAMLTGMVGFQLTSQDNFGRLLHTAFTSESDGESSIDEMYHEMIDHCQANPGELIDLESETGIPITIDCDDVSGLDPDGLFEYLINEIAALLWQGEISLSEFVGEDDEGEENGFEGIFEMFTFKGNAMFYGLIVLSVVPATWFGIAIVTITPPDRRLRRFGMVFFVEGLIGFSLSVVLFSIFGVLADGGGDGEGFDTAGIIGVFSGPLYNTFAAVLILGVIMITIHVLQKRMTGRGNRGD